MKTIAENKSELLLKTIENLKSQKTDYKSVAEELFKFEFEDFNAAFNLKNSQVPDNSYVRLPIYSENCCAILMLWGINNKAAIHDHLNYDGLIKVLKGNLTEISYIESNDFIEYEGEGIASEGAVFPEDLGGIHSVINNSSDISVSLHIYHTPQTSLKGVRLFDIENKKIGYLNEKATCCSWNIPTECFDKIVQL